MEKGGNGDGVSHSGDPDTGDDPEVTAITRRLDRTGDTLGAMTELEQLLIERTGQIPVISPAGAQNPPTPEPEQPSEPDDIDWSLPARTPLDPAPGFGAWVDPDAIAAAFDADAGEEFTDVSTKVFAVFSAERLEAERPEPAPGPVPIPDLEPGPRPAARVEQAPEEPDELDGIDDLASSPPPVLLPEEPEPEPSDPEPVPAAEPAVEAPAEEEPEQRKKRRFWPFGRR